MPRIKLCRLAKELNDKKALDIALSKVVSLTNPEHQARIHALGIVEEEVPFRRFLQFRYQLDIDGFSNAWKSCFLKLLSGSLLFKVESNYQQWYYPLLKPWEHYIPITSDLSDLLSQLEWARSHDAECRKIAQAARTLALSFRYEDFIYQFAALGYQLFSKQQ